LYRPAEYFDLDSPLLSALFEGVDKVWEVLPRLPSFLENLLKGERVIRGDVSPEAHLADSCPMYIDATARVEPGAYIAAPTYIGPGAVVRHGAYVRENCLFLDGSVLGHASEAKSSLFLPDAKAPHLSYVGDSILGHRVNLGAGTKLSNVPLARSPQSTIRIHVGTDVMDTGLRKLGAIIGDDSEIGCNVVTNPGVLLGRGTWIYPNSTIRSGAHDAGTIWKLRQELLVEARREGRLT
jgi:NDP-sugar pyrophosphorylase family protein